MEKKVKENMELAIKEHFAEIIKLCKKIGILGKYCDVGKYYVSFDFRPRKDICKECGKEI